MREQELRAFQQHLLRRGIAPAVAERVAEELGEHYEDLVTEFRARGMADAAARRRAAMALGKLEDVAAAMDGSRELKTWPYRYPRAALIVYPLACAAALPAAPVLAGLAHAQQLARWGASLLAAGVFTGALLLLMQLSILFG